MTDRGADEPARFEVVVRGRVQGVGFRYFVVQEAQRQGLQGWVMNERGGTVRVVAEGDRADLDRLLERLSVGPPGAHVVDLEVRWSGPSGAESRFGVRSGGHSGD